VLQCDADEVMRCNHRIERFHKWQESVPAGMYVCVYVGMCVGVCVLVLVCVAMCVAV